MKNFRPIFVLVVALTACSLAWPQYKNLAEALGYKAEARVLIINADDFGMCHAENLGTQQVLEYGVVSSTTMMVVCPWVLEAIEYINNNNMKNVGVHVALTSEWRHYRWRPLSFGHSQNSLVDAKGYMWHESDEVERFANLLDVIREVRAQLQFAKDHGVDLSHFDSHMGSLYGHYTGRIELLAAALAISYEFGLPYRVPYIPVLLDPFRDMGFAIIDRLEFGASQPSDPKERRAFFLKLFKELPAGVTEVYIHPALATEELKNITAMHSMRQGDVDIFTDPEIKQSLIDNNIHVISFERLRQYQRENTGWKPGRHRAEDLVEKYRTILLEQMQRSSVDWREELQKAAFCPK